MARKSPNPKGKPSKLKKARPVILKGLADAIPIRSACLIAGIGVQTLRDWKLKGKANLDAIEAAHKAGRRAPALDEYGDFLNAADIAEAKAEGHLIRAVQEKNPLEILKRRFRKDWGDRKLVALEGTDGEPIKTDGGGGAVVNLNLTFENPDDEELWVDGDDEEEGGGA